MIPVTTQGVRSLDGAQQLHKTPALILNSRTESESDILKSL